MAALSGVAALALLEVDRNADAAWVADLPWIHDATAEGSRSILGVVAGSMINVTGVVFSITIVALTLASSQFGPRLLRSFMRDRASQAVMGMFVATFLFNLLVLRAIDSTQADAFVPHLSITAAVVLGIASLFVLIFFIHHAASSIQAAAVIQSVASEIDVCLPLVFPDQVGESAKEETAQYDAWRKRLRDGQPVRAQTSGYVRVIDSDLLMNAAEEHDVVLGVDCRPGTFASRGTRLATVGGAASDELIDAVRGAFVLGSQRSAVQDLGHLTDQLTEMAVRALSPGINDPRTAIACVHRLGDVLASLAARPFPSAFRLDDAGALRVVAEPPGFEDLAHTMISPIRHYGAGDPEVCLALLAALGHAQGAALPERRDFMLRLADEVREASLGAAGAPSDRERLLRAWERVVEIHARTRDEREESNA
jgi:uncharacterized membrane protein